MDLVARVSLLIVNVGSSSVKLRVLARPPRAATDPTGPAGAGPGADGDELVASVDLPADPPTDDVVAFTDHHPDIDVVAHRVVHGGPHLEAPVVVTDEVLAELDRVSVLAPLHNPPAVHMIRRLLALRPDLPAVACFDTAFHAHMPAWAHTYAVPQDWTERLGVRRYGFHGLSHAWATGRAAVLLGRPVHDLRLVTAHLGAGASLAAVAAGRSVDTTMGFTPLEGLVMATRSGNVDPGALLWLQDTAGFTAPELFDALHHRSGLAGLTGGSGEMRAVLDAADHGEAAAQLAIAVYVHRLKQGVAAMAAALGGLDALVFTGGVGEHAPRIRQATCAGLGLLGLGVDRGRDEAVRVVEADADVSTAGARARVLVVAAREDLEMARQVRDLLADQPVGAR